MITVKLSLRSKVRLSFFLWPEDLNMKAKKARTFPYFLFLIFYLRYISCLGSSLAMSRALVRHNLGTVNK